MKIIVILIIIISLIFFVHILNKKVKKDYDSLEENIKLIDSKIGKLRTVDDCTKILHEIAEYHDGTSQMMKGIRDEYRKRYYMVAGAKYIIQILNKNESISANGFNV